MQRSESEPSGTVIADASDAMRIFSPSEAGSVSRFQGLRRCLVVNQRFLNQERSKHDGQDGPVLAALASLVIRDVAQSVLLCGHVGGATQVFSVEDCVMVLACGQLRLSGCRRLKVYVHCTSQPAMDQCDDIDMAALPECFVRATRWKVG